MRLIDLIAQLHALDDAETIYAKEPWSEDCEAMTAPEDRSGALAPPALEMSGFKYFLEVFIAQQFVDDWRQSTGRTPSASELCARLIQYAVNDA
jgi:hypothetical protein